MSVGLVFITENKNKFHLMNIVILLRSSLLLLLKLFPILSAGCLIRLLLWRQVA